MSKKPDGDQKKIVSGAGTAVKKKSNRALKIFAFLFIFILLLALAGYIYLNFFLIAEVRETQKVLLDDRPQNGEGEDISDSFSEDIVNIGLLGFDRGWNRESYGEYLFRPDMMAVFSINFADDSISVVRFPRDSYVPVNGTGGRHDKMNHSYSYGYYSHRSEDPHADGIETTLMTMSDVLGGIPIHYYISVDMYSIVELVDAVGGIYFEVDEQIIDKHWEIGRVLVPAGPQIMDGKTYLRYLQYRDDKSGQDFGRMDRQMELLKETFIYLKEEGKITDLPTTYRIYKDYVDTDLTYKQIAALAFYGRDFEIGDDNLKFYTMKGGGQMKDGIWYQIINQPQRVAMIKEVFGLDVTPWPAIVLEDSPEYIAEQEKLKRLAEMGLTIDPETGETVPLEKFPEDEEQIGEELEGEEKEGSPVSGRSFALPDVIGMPVEEAKTVLRASGFQIGEVTERHNLDRKAGTVIVTHPLPGSSSFLGAPVDIVVVAGE